MSDPLEKLTELLRKLPGIGPRQSRRLAFWLVRQDVRFIEDLSTLLRTSRKNIQVCDSCKKLFPKQNGNTCSICINNARDDTLLMLVERDVDLENIEKTGAYSGKYFVLGGTTSPLDKEPQKKIRILDLLKKLKAKESSVSEIIYALSATTDGEDTILFLDNELKKVVEKDSIKITKLGRGLSTGTELEYVDRDTMNHALKGRS